MDAFDFRERMNSGVDPETEDLARAVIGAAIKVHKELGPGMPEGSYLLAMCHELDLRGIVHQPENPVTILYKGKEVGLGRIDLLVDGRLVIELKSVDAIAPVHCAQCLTYLRLLRLKLGLVLNFNVERMRQGVKRIVNSH